MKTILSNTLIWNDLLVTLSLFNNLMADEDDSNET